MFTGNGRISADDPAPTAAGDAYLELDLDGRLAYLRIVPPREEMPEAEAVAVDWSAALEAAGVSTSRLTAVEPRIGPLYAFDARAAWEGVAGDEPVRAEAAARNGKVTYFRIALARVWRAGVETRPVGAWPLFAYFSATLLLGGLGFLAFLALRNLRLGRGDRRSAFRLAVFIFVMLTFAGVVGRHWVLAPGTPERMSGSLIFTQVMITFGYPLFFGLETWLAYMGFEPYVRRRWPHLLITSTRLLDGRWRDPLVGRSVLTGVLSALVAQVLVFWSIALARDAGWGEVVPSFTPRTLDGVRAFVAYLAIAVPIFVQFSIVYVAVLLFSRVVLRNATAAWMGLLAVFFLMYAGWLRVFLGPVPAVMVAGAVILAGASVFVFWRDGLLALAVWLVVVLLMRDTPWTPSLNQWYAAPTWISSTLIAGLTWWGFRNVLGRQSVFPASLEQ